MQMMRVTHVTHEMRVTHVIRLMHMMCVMHGMMKFFWFFLTTF
jgi:hypothetical protein